MDHHSSGSSGVTVDGGPGTSQLADLPATLIACIRMLLEELHMADYSGASKPGEVIDKAVKYLLIVVLGVVLEE
eukprot:CAMPEP_0114476400 /NCGR_PEP_ID=MMETSP0104-20121206/14729_1 /TAXON_ID=37642 ORGANISM="Paraphysomonas imperforata, Strain PA2" /NCGR_SAMPLE_ID=MMETSP0104 /ASSEMBLY_ACC=CAM_ASM_000202 /LENGTH=73 /DNA_ID=CAMNT_0001651117 /DNA_START=296 /DNA_END=517 /DNA_ORIENTATION=-